MYAISVWLCTVTAWVGDSPHQRVEVFRTQGVCLEFCDKAVEFHRGIGLQDIQCHCEHRVVSDHLMD